MHSDDGAVSTRATSRLFMPYHTPLRMLSLGIVKSIIPSCIPHPVAELHWRPGEIQSTEFVERNMPQNTLRLSRLLLNAQ